MKKLISTIYWLELQRIKNRIWILAVIVFGFAMFSGSCDQSNFQFEMNSTSSPSDNDPIGPVFYESLFTILPTVLMTFAALIIGYVVILTIPFRDKEEWENGQFQMQVMGQFSQYQIQAARFLVYLLIATGFFILICINSTLLAWKSDSLDNETIISFQTLVSYWCLALVPLLIAFGCFVSSITMAYYRDGDNKFITLIKYLGSYGFAMILLKVSAWFTDPEKGFFDPNFLVFEVNSRRLDVGIHWEFPILTILVATVLLFWSGRILDEVEA